MCCYQQILVLCLYDIFILELHVFKRNKPSSQLCLPLTTTGW